MAVKVYKNGAWNDTETLKRNSGGSWAECEAAKRWNGSAWVPVWEAYKSICTMLEHNLSKAVGGNASYVDTCNAGNDRIVGSFRTRSRGRYVTFEINSDDPITQFNFDFKIIGDYHWGDTPYCNSEALRITVSMYRTGMSTLVKEYRNDRDDYYEYKDKHVWSSPFYPGYKATVKVDIDTGYTDTGTAYYEITNLKVNEDKCKIEQFVY